MQGVVERGFVGLAVAVLVVSVAAAGVSVGADGDATAADGDATTAVTDGRFAVDTDVPDEYDFSAPTAEGVARVDGREFDSVQAAVDAADPGETVVLSGRFDERVVVGTPDLTLTSADGALALIDGSGEGDTLVVNADGVTVRRVWVRNSGFDTAKNDAGIWVNGSDARVVDSRVTDITFGIWVDGVDGVLLRNNTIVGREEVTPLSYRGNGIQLWRTEGTVVRHNRITDTRDGIYYSWAHGVLGANNTMWDLRYGVHFMYSDDCRLVGNLAFDNDAGYALMVSKRLELVDNVAVNNTGTSGHGVLVKDIDDTTIRNNSLVGNGRGVYVYNSLNNTVAGNLVLANDVGVYIAAGSDEERVVGNSFVHNGRAVLAVTSGQLAWNGTDRGNYWSGAHTTDLDEDGVSEVRHRPSGVVEQLVQEHPQAGVFAGSPAFDALRLAESTFPVVESPGVVDHHPLAEPPHEDWRRYHGRD